MKLWVLGSRKLQAAHDGQLVCLDLFPEGLSRD